MEIERQFLVQKIPALPKNFHVLEQGYIALLPEIRIRAIDEKKFFLTVKRGAGLVREEWETEINREEYQSLQKRLMPNTGMIEKRRYYLALADGHTAELNIHSGHLAGFVYVEVEFPSKEQALAFQPPDWFGREVTDDARFSYGRLAMSDGMDVVQTILASEYA